MEDIGVVKYHLRKRNLRLKAGTNIEARAEGIRINFYADLVEDYEDCT